jgi:hypothetical protein
MTQAAAPAARGLRRSSYVYARRIALALGIAASSAAARVDAGTDRPVFVTVAGQGAIRFRLAAGPIAPCDSSGNRIIFDGWLSPGRYQWDARADLVCYEYTSGALRESNWSEARIVSTVIGNKFRRRATQIVVLTE